MSGVTAEGTPAPDVPPATLCTAEAPTFERLNALISAAAGTPVALSTPGLVPEGTPAASATVAEVSAVVRELVGCYNAGEPLRAYGLFTDGYLRRLFARQGAPGRVEYDRLATPEPDPDLSRHTAILAIADVRLLGDGRVGAMVTLRYASIPMPKTFFFTFVWIGERWLIDNILGEISFSVP